jgi:hypothetical protein
MLGQPQLPWGRLADEFAGTVVWILPNPSGLNRSFTLDALVMAYAELHRALSADEELCTPTVSRRLQRPRRRSLVGSGVATPWLRRSRPA